MIDLGRISENMTVRARDGEELGTVIRVEEAGILVEKGISFLDDYLVPASLVADVRDGDVWLACTREELRARSAAGARDAVVRRTLREETAEFVHEGEGAGPARASRMPDGLREGEAGSGHER